MKRIWSIMVYGVLMGMIFFLLEALSYRTLIRDISMEVYGGLIGLIFLSLGVWVGKTLVDRKKPKTRTLNPNNQLSEREYEVLHLIADGQSNQEIADQLFVSLNTVKTHIANIFSKLDVQRRTQAIQRARELEILDN